VERENGALGAGRCLRATSYLSLNCGLVFAAHTGVRLVQAMDLRWVAPRSFLGRESALHPGLSSCFPTLRATTAQAFLVRVYLVSGVQEVRGVLGRRARICPVDNSFPSTSNAPRQRPRSFFVSSPWPAGRWTRATRKKKQSQGALGALQKVSLCTACFSKPLFGILTIGYRGPCLPVQGRVRKYDVQYNTYKPHRGMER